MVLCGCWLRRNAHRCPIPPDTAKWFVLKPVVGARAGTTAPPSRCRSLRVARAVAFDSVRLIAEMVGHLRLQRPADQRAGEPFQQAIDGLRLDKHCFLVSVTRGHAYDEEAVAAALRQPCGFVGMIGSRRRVRTTLDRLVEAGIARERTEDVHAPLGLDIGAETPEEIAIAIIAEIIRERRTGVRDDFTLGAKSGRLRRKA